MHAGNPLRSIAPTVDADVLQVLARTPTSLSGARIAALSGRSYAQVRAVLLRLANSGLATVERHGATYSYRLNRDHVLATPVLALSSAWDQVEQQITQRLEGWRVPAVSVVLFGSAARRDGDEDSDVDVLLVRPEGVSVDHETWQHQRHELVLVVRLLTGNPVQVVELSESDLDEAVRADRPLIANVRRDGVSLVGVPLSRLLRAAVAARLAAS